MAERKCVIDESLRKNTSSLNQLVSSKLVQSLIEKEKRKLVKNVRFHMQLKKFYTKDAANRSERKRKLSVKRRIRESQVEAAEKQKRERARELGDIIRARFGVRDELLKLNELEFN